MTCDIIGAREFMNGRSWHSTTKCYKQCLLKEEDGHKKAATATKATRGDLGSGRQGRKGWIIGFPSILGRGTKKVE